MTTFMGDPGFEWEDDGGGDAKAVPLRASSVERRASSNVTHHIAERRAAAAALTVRGALLFGLLVTALYSPVWTSAVHSGLDFAIAAVGCERRAKTGRTARRPAPLASFVSDSTGS
ncbi:hypothetical protein [Burkholderia guangdongensis]|uniref:hypothetical protein n=1 Tax=Burkholderia guangdongensis TaxID=1792500 RepID=UPI0015CB05E0|nr:hypothetical protein [Burkholderia guangdongensis]